MSAFFNSDGSFPLQFVMIFVVIFVVLAALVLVFRRFAGKGMSLSSKSGPRGRQPRLGIVDIYELDRQRQLILLRRDNVEHLLLVGGPNDVIVERNINRGASARLALDEAARVEPADEPVFEPARPADQASAGVAPFPQPVFEQPVPQQPVPQRPMSQAPDFEMPDLRPPAAAPGAGFVDQAAPQRDVSTDPKQAGRPSRAEVIAARAARRNPPPLANLKPETADRPRVPGGRPGGDVDPSFDAVEPAPEAPAVSNASSAPVRSEERSVQPRSAVEPAPAGAAAPASAPPVPPPIMRPPSSRPVDAAILSDMARQLEEALRRPSAAVSPAMAPVMTSAVPPTAQAGLSPDKSEAPAPKPQAEPKRQEEVKSQAAPTPQAESKPAPAREHDEPEDRAVDSMAAAMAASFEAAPAEPVTAPETPKAAAPANEPEPFLPAPPPPPAPEVEAPRRASPPAQNPFSVEEIEAEFARLLGRPLDKKG